MGLFAATIKEDVIADTVAIDGLILDGVTVTALVAFPVPPK